MTVWLLLLTDAVFGGVVLGLPLLGLLYPSHPIKLGPVTLLSLVKRRTPELKTQTIEALQENLRAEDLSELLTAPGLIGSICEQAQKAVDEQLDRIGENLPSMLSSMYTGRLKSRLSDAASRRLQQRLPDLVKSMSERMVPELELNRLLEDQVSMFFDEEFEPLVRQALGRLPVVAPLCGAAAGLLLGVFQALILF